MADTRGSAHGDSGVRASARCHRDPPGVQVPHQLPSGPRCPGQILAAVMIGELDAYVPMTTRSAVARRRYLMAYDFSDPKRLRRVCKVMEAYGERLQYSVFLCDLSDMELTRWKFDMLRE